MQTAAVAVYASTASGSVLMPVYSAHSCPSSDEHHVKHDEHVESQLAAEKTSLEHAESQPAAEKTGLEHAIASILIYFSPSRSIALLSLIFLFSSLLSSPTSALSYLPGSPLFSLPFYPCANITTPQLRSTILTLVAAMVQLAALLWYLVSYFPMGSSGLRFAAQFGTNRVAAWMGG
jgi:hypothetical protein